MRSYGLTISTRTDPSLFLVTNPIKPDPFFFNPKSPTRIQFPTLKTKSSPKCCVSATSPTADMSFYDLLGIPNSVTFPEIKQAYKQTARKYHPDVSPPGRVEEYTQIFIRVQEAYETLSDPGRRAVYDRDLARGIHLAFTSRRRYQYHEDIAEKEMWGSRWQSQLSELKKRSTKKDAEGNLSWGARMRQQREERSTEA